MMERVLSNDASDWTPNLLFDTKYVDVSRLSTIHVYEPTRKNAVKLILPVSQDACPRFSANSRRFSTRLTADEFWDGSIERRAHFWLDCDRHALSASAPRPDTGHAHLTQRRIPSASGGHR